MRLYSRVSATAVDDPETGEHYEAGAGGAFDLSDGFASRQLGFHAGGRPMWETDIQRQHRQIAEELQRRQSPEALYEAVRRLVDVAESAPAPTKAAPKPARAATASKS